MSNSESISFKEVKSLHKRCQEKGNQVSKKRKKRIFVTCSILFPIEAIIVAFTLNKSIGFTAVHLLVLIMAALFVCLFQAFVISIIVLLTTYKDTTLLRNYYTNYERAYRTYFIHRQLTKIFSDLHYNHERGLDKKSLEETGLINTGDRYKSNDLVVAKYKNTRFSQADVKIEERHERRNEDGRVEVYYDTIFEGRFLIFEFPKKFDFKMTVSHSGFNGGYLNPKTKRGLSRIETESTEFNKRFLVYAEDGFEAFYILNPDFIHKLEQLGEKYRNALSLYFSDNKMYVGLNDGSDAFEPPSSYENLDEAVETEKAVNDMKLITELVDNLKLNHS